MSLKVLVTGGAGHVGGWVCAALAEAGVEACAVDRVYRSDLPVRLDVMDLCDPLSAYRACEGCSAVVHLANHANAYVGTAQQVYTENVTMDFNVFQAAVETGVEKIVFASSVQVIAGDRSGDDASRPSCLAYLPMDGDLPTCPRNPYALSKEAGELQLRYHALLHPALSCTAVRFPMVVDGEHVAWWLHRGGRRWGRRYYNLDEGFTYLEGRDAASLVLAIIQRQAPGYHQFFPAAPDSAVNEPIAEIVRTYYPTVPLRVPAEQMTSLVDLSAITAKVGWTPQHVGLFAGGEE